MKNVRRRLIVTAAITLGISVFAWYPLLADRFGLPRPDFIESKRLRLGLDLKGGVQMVLRVNTDDAVMVETHAAAGRVGEALTRQHVTTGSIEVLGLAGFEFLKSLPQTPRRFGESRMKRQQISRPR